MTVQESFDHLVERVRGYNPSANFDLIRSAFEFADKAHEGQLRKDNSPFVTHPLAVAQIVAEELHLDSESIAAALLHRPFLYNYELSREKIQKDKQMWWNNRQNA